MVTFLHFQVLLDKTVPMLTSVIEFSGDKAPQAMVPVSVKLKLLNEVLSYFLRMSTYCSMAVRFCNDAVQVCTKIDASFAY